MARATATAATGTLEVPPPPSLPEKALITTDSSGLWVPLDLRGLQA